ncbi:MAG: hypothetical protein PHS64_01945 [Candidatus Omnitrophica bacterium]|nr:hypothetical protein [Candidatus Omnitrophota bacterium]
MRQVYYSLVLAQWFKQKAKGQANAYSQAIDTKDLTGLITQSAWSKDTYYNAYKKSFSEGEYKKEEQVSTSSGLVIRTYFSGGVNMDGGSLHFTIPSGAGIAEFLAKMDSTSAGASIISPARDSNFSKVEAFFMGYRNLSGTQQRPTTYYSSTDPIKPEEQELYRELLRMKQQLGSVSARDGGAVGFLIQPEAVWFFAYAALIGSMTLATLILRKVHGRVGSVEAGLILAGGGIAGTVIALGLAGSSILPLLPVIKLAMPVLGLTATNYVDRGGITAKVRQRIVQALKEADSWKALKEQGIYPAYLGDQMLRDKSLWAEFENFMKRINNLPDDFHYQEDKENDEDLIIHLLSAFYGEQGKGPLVQTASLFNKSQTWLSYKINGSDKIKAALKALNDVASAKAKIAEIMPLIVEAKQQISEIEGNAGQGNDLDDASKASGRTEKIMEYLKNNPYGKGFGGDLFERLRATAVDLADVLEKHNLDDVQYYKAGERLSAVMVAMGQEMMKANRLEIHEFLGDIKRKVPARWKAADDEPINDAVVSVLDALMNAGFDQYYISSVMTNYLLPALRAYKDDTGGSEQNVKDGGDIIEDINEQARFIERLRLFAQTGKFVQGNNVSTIADMFKAINSSGNKEDDIKNIFALFQVWTMMPREIARGLNPAIKRIAREKSRDPEINSALDDIYMSGDEAKMQAVLLVLAGALESAIGGLSAQFISDLRHAVRTGQFKATGEDVNDALIRMLVSEQPVDNKAKIKLILTHARLKSGLADSAELSILIEIIAEEKYSDTRIKEYLLDPAAHINALLPELVAALVLKHEERTIDEAIKAGTAVNVDVRGPRQNTVTVFPQSRDGKVFTGYISAGRKFAFMLGSELRSMEDLAIPPDCIAIYSGAINVRPAPDDTRLRESTVSSRRVQLVKVDRQRIVAGIDKLLKIQEAPGDLIAALAQRAPDTKPENYLELILKQIDLFDEINQAGIITELYETNMINFGTRWRVTLLGKPLCEMGLVRIPDGSGTEKDKIQEILVLDEKDIPQMLSNLETFLIHLKDNSEENQPSAADARGAAVTQSKDGGDFEVTVEDMEALLDSQSAASESLAKFMFSDRLKYANGIPHSLIRTVVEKCRAQGRIDQFWNQPADETRIHGSLVKFIKSHQGVFIEARNARAAAAKHDGGGRTGGIDFRALPLVTQPGMNPSMMQPAIDMTALHILAQQSKMQDLDKEWARIQKQIAGKAMPYEKIKEYLAVCSDRKASGESLSRVEQCLSNILKLEEACAVSTSAQMKELLLIVETVRT